MGKHKYCKGMGFLHISRETKIHTILKTWEKWILIARETHGKTQTFQSYGFLTYFMCSINPCNFQNMGCVNSHVKGKVWENTNIPKLWVSYVFHMKQKSIQFPSHRWIPTLRNKNRKIRAIPRFCSSLLMKTHPVSNVWECTNSYKMEIFCGKPYHSQAAGFWRNLGVFFPVHGKKVGVPKSFPFIDLERLFLCIYTIPKTWEK